MSSAFSRAEKQQPSVENRKPDWNRSNQIEIERQLMQLKRAASSLRALMCTEEILLCFWTQSV